MLRLPALLITTLLLAITAQSQDVCIDVCQVNKPNCPSGQYSPGQPGCWSCCRAQENDSA